LQQRKKILFIHASAEVGGTENSSFQIASRLDRKKYDLGVLFHSSPGPLMDNYRQAGIPYWGGPFPHLRLALRVVKEFNPDIVQIYGIKNNVLWRPLLFLRGYRQLIGVTQGLTTQGDKPGRTRILLDRLTHRLLQHYIVDSQRVADTLVKRGFETSKLKVIYNGIPLPVLSPTQKRQNDPPVIVCVGNLRPVKGHTYLLLALKILLDHGIRFQAWIVGDGPLKEELTTTAKTLQLSPFVSFMGRVNSVEAVLREADIFASLSLSEGIPIALMEAMSFGLPVVATDVGGVSELINDGSSGSLIPNKGIHEAASRLEMLLTHPTLRTRIGRNARQIIASRFSIENTVQEYEKLYAAIVRNG
jgi:glycosyltransferase involved in cell wall biosynthesis